MFECTTVTWLSFFYFFLGNNAYLALKHTSMLTFTNQHSVIYLSFICYYDYNAFFGPTARPRW